MFQTYVVNAGRCVENPAAPAPLPFLTLPAMNFDDPGRPTPVGPPVAPPPAPTPGVLPVLTLPTAADYYGR